MAKEIERKFLLKNNSYKKLGKAVHIEQGYICAEKERVVRIRIYGKKGFVTIKNASIGFSRDEFEYEIPLSEAQAMLRCVCIQPTIEKERYKIRISNFTWEVDEFHGENEGLTIAEIELSNEEAAFTIPDWIGEEVTGDIRYYNANLFKTPYCKWKK